MKTSCLAQIYLALIESMVEKVGKTQRCLCLFNFSTLQPFN
jgi:hypothetical protein